MLRTSASGLKQKNFPAHTFCVSICPVRRYAVQRINGPLHWSPYPIIIKKIKKRKIIDLIWLLAAYNLLSSKYSRSSIPFLNSPSGIAAERLVVLVQKVFDKWFLPVVFVAIGSLMVWALWRG
jgi:hypothetical protein